MFGILLVPSYQIFTRGFLGRRDPIKVWRCKYILNNINIDHFLHAMILGDKNNNILCTNGLKTRNANKYLSCLYIMTLQV